MSPDSKAYLPSALLAGLLLCAALAMPVSSRADCPRWPLWDAYVARFVQADGRVIDYQRGQGITTSEGQAYTLFFALVTNDRDGFDTLLRWTQTHLMASDPQHRLPAWLWGSHPSGQWQVLDPNSASDADLWLAYTLLQAGRLWQEPAYTELAHNLMDQIAEREVAWISGLGPLLLPGTTGFVLGKQRWLLNPSYSPIQLLRALHGADPEGPWGAMADNTARMIRESQPRQLAADWVVYDAVKGWEHDGDKGPIGSYDAIRVYLWAGMLHGSEPHKPPLLDALRAMAALAVSPRNPPPEKVNTLTGETRGKAPAGFSAALLPYLTALGEADAAAVQRERIRRKSTGPLVGEHQHYYDQVLALFGEGWINGRYRFGAGGELMPAWQTGCGSNGL